MPRFHPLPEPRPRTHTGNAPIIDAPLRAALDRANSLAARLIDASIATFVLVDGDQYVAAASAGLGTVPFADFPLPLEGSLCDAVIRSGQRFVTDAASRDTDLDSDMVDFGVAYAATPLVSIGGDLLGVFAAISHEPRHWSVSDLAILDDFAGLVTDHLSFDDIIGDGRR